MRRKKKTVTAAPGKKLQTVPTRQETALAAVTASSTATVPRPVVKEYTLVLLEDVSTKFNSIDYL